MILFFVALLAVLGVLSLGVGLGWLSRQFGRKRLRALLTWQGVSGIALVTVGTILLYLSFDLWNRPLP